MAAMGVDEAPWRSVDQLTRRTRWMVHSDPTPQSINPSRIETLSIGAQQNWHCLGSGADRKWDSQSVDSEASTVATRTPEEQAAESNGPASRETGPKPGPLVNPKNQGLLCSQARPTLIFDWDDTLFPCSHITSVLRRVFRGANEGHVKIGPQAPEYAELARHARLVRDVLHAASEVAHVAIVTSATRGWIPFTTECYLPGLDIEELLLALDITVYYANEFADGLSTPYVWDSTNVDPQVAAKRNAMAFCLEAIYDTGSDAWRAMSIGDSMVEQVALKEVMRIVEREKPSVQQPMCKTVKLMEVPSIVELGSELKILRRWLSNFDFDMCEVDDFILDSEKLISASPDMPPVPPDLPPEPPTQNSCTISTAHEATVWMTKCRSF